jgi:hypothetical protein
MNARGMNTRIIKTLVLALLGACAWTCTALASDDNACEVAGHLVSADFRLPHVAEAIANKRLDIVVAGTTSSLLSGSMGTARSYPARLEAALASKLPGIAVKIITYAKAGVTAAEMEKQFTQILGGDRPALVIWQTGTVEAMRRLDPDEFRGVLDDGIDVIQAAKSDVVLMNMQYSPRTELMIAVPPYSEAMRFAALQHEINLFDRLAVMRHWGELGVFDLIEATKKIDTAARVHNCVGQLLGRLIIEAASLPMPSDRGNH